MSGTDAIWFYVSLFWQINMTDARIISDDYVLAE
jgi:hypothetical protein